MYHTTGFTRDQVDELCAQVRAANEVTAEPEKVTWPPILGLFKSVVVTLTYLRRLMPNGECTTGLTWGEGS